MALSNQERVGKAMELLRAGLAPFGAAEALAYNGLVQSWPEITRLAREDRTPAAEQPGLFSDPDR